MASRLIKKKEQVKIQDKFMQLEREDGEVKLKLTDEVEGKGDELPFLLVPDTINENSTWNELLTSIGINVEELAPYGTYFYTVFFKKYISLSGRMIYASLATISIATYGSITLSLKQSKPDVQTILEINRITDFTKTLGSSAYDIQFYSCIPVNSDRQLLSNEHGTLKWLNYYIYCVKLFDSNNKHLATITLTTDKSYDLNDVDGLGSILNRYYDNSSTAKYGKNSSTVYNNGEIIILEGCRSQYGYGSGNRVYVDINTITISNGAFTATKSTDVEITSIEVVSKGRIF